MPLICCEVLWCRYHRVSVTGTLPWAYGLSQTKSSATTLLSIQRETALVHKYSLPLTFLCGLANYSHMYAIPPLHILLMSHAKRIQALCSLRRDKEHQKTNLQLLWVALTSHQQWWTPGIYVWILIPLLFPEPWFTYRPLEILNLLWIKNLQLEHLNQEAHNCPQQKKITWDTAHSV